MSRSRKLTRSKSSEGPAGPIGDSGPAGLVGQPPTRIHTEVITETYSNANPDYLRYIRVTNDITQAEVASVLKTPESPTAGVSVAYVSMLESGARKAPIPILTAYEHAIAKLRAMRKKDK
jgi:hypothetical protein